MRNASFHGKIRMFTLFKVLKEFFQFPRQKIIWPHTRQSTSILFVASSSKVREKELPQNQ